MRRATEMLYLLNVINRVKLHWSQYPYPNQFTVEQVN